VAPQGESRGTANEPLPLRLADCRAMLPALVVGGLDGADQQQMSPAAQEWLQPLAQPFRQRHQADR